jgi:hypothetical protein
MHKQPKTVILTYTLFHVQKSDLLSGGRKLIHENVTRWVSARGKVQGKSAFDKVFSV